MFHEYLSIDAAIWLGIKDGLIHLEDFQEAGRLLASGDGSVGVSRPQRVLEDGNVVQST